MTILTSTSGHTTGVVYLQTPACHIDTMHPIVAQFTVTPVPVPMPVIVHDIVFIGSVGRWALPQTPIKPIRNIYGLARRRRHLTPCRPVGLLGPGQPAGGSPPGAVRLLWCRGAALLASGPWPAPCRAAACASPLSDLPCHEQAPPSPQQSPKEGPEGPAFLGEVSPELSRLQLATDEETDEDMELEDELD